MINATLPTATALSRCAAPRLDLYTPIHKALRAFLADTLCRLGRVDVEDEVELEQVCVQVQGLLRLLRSHIQHEDDFLHAAIEARRPDGARRTGDDHLQHQEDIRNLDDQAQALRHARPGQRVALALGLYRHLSVFAAHNLEHMLVEESENTAALWALYSDAELAALHGALMATIGPDEMALVVRWMAAGLTPQELAGLFAGVRRLAPPAAFEALFDTAMAQLDEGRRAKLARALGLPPVRGLIGV